MELWPTAVEVHEVGDRVHRAPGARMRLSASGDGWSLMGPAGEVVFRAQGIRGRRACLEFARRRGVLAVFS